MPTRTLVMPTITAHTHTPLNTPNPITVATDERPTSPHGTHIHPSAPTPDPSLVQYQPARPRGRSPSPRGARSHPAPQILQLHGSVQQYQTHVFAPPVTGPPSKKKALEKTNTLVEPLNGSSTPQRYANAAAAAGLPPGGFPATNDKGQRICRQCGLPGRYKDGKCVEKWGPGPEGPGTVCDRCRKKMKRVERRGTLDTLAQAQAQHASFTSPPQLDESPPTHPADAPPRAMGTGLARGNTVTVSHSHPPIATLAEPDSETSPQAYRAPHSHAHPAHPSSRPAGESASSRSPGSRGSLHGPHSDDDGDVEMAPASYPHGPGKAARVSPPHVHVHAHAPLVRRSSGEDDDAEGEIEDADGEAEDDVDVDDDLLDAVNASEANGHGHVVNGAANGAGVSWVKREADAMEV
ncbi:hypothetical protein OF83DRAFT_1089352 [Amylostereum chailletii]|nr:hypothetical protein OF83DRAFT_1089352 [Amylostereum chailletii]